MSSFCNYCGRPLPENGVCQCRMQQPQQPQYQQPQYQQPQYQQPQYQQPQYQQPQYQQPQYQQPQYQQPQYQQPQYQQPQYPQQYQQPQAPAQPSAFGKAFSDLMPFVKSFMQNSTAAVKKVVAEKGLVFALIITGFFAVISMLSWMTASFGISLNTIGSINRFTPTIAPLLVGMFFPLIMVALAALSYFLGGKMSKKNVSFVDALTAAGSASILPAVIMAVAIILNLWFYSGVLLFCLFACAAVVVYFMNLREVFEIKGFLPMIVQIGFSAVTFAIGLFLMAESIIGAWFFF